MEYVDVIFASEDFEVKQSVAPGRVDYARCAIVAVGNHKGGAGGQQAFGDMAKGAALDLQYQQFKVHAQAHELRIVGFPTINKANFPAAQNVFLFE